jgi:predicted metalloprotease with PDZ domain
VSLLWNEFPVPRATIILYPLDSSRVGFGWTTRGGGPSIAIGVGKDITAAALHDDWVAVHEMLHLGIPTLEDHGRWLSEGLATYYEPLLRARAGLLEPDKVWEILHEGFGRGARQCQTSQLTLRQDSDTMDQTRRYWRVYWSGAAIALLADVALRQRGSSLDHELARMRDCCLSRSRALGVDELLKSAELPAHQAEPAPPGLAATAAPHLDSPEFPDVSAAFQALGLSFDSRGRPRASEDPRAAALRTAMTGQP